jgi:hypothetical protein
VLTDWEGLRVLVRDVLEVGEDERHSVGEGEGLVLVVLVREIVEETEGERQEEMEAEGVLVTLGHPELVRLMEAQAEVDALRHREEEEELL